MKEIAEKLRECEEDDVKKSKQVIEAGDDAIQASAKIV